jgi:HEAT repeat protein
MGHAKLKMATCFPQTQCDMRCPSSRILSQITLVFVCTLGCNSNKVAAETRADASAIAAAAVVPNLLAESIWQDNQTYVFELALSSRAGMAGALPMAQYEMHGSLVVTARKASANSVQLAVHIAGSQFRTEKSNAQPMYDALTKELERPSLIKLSQGQITEERIAPGLSSFAETIIRYVGTIFQLRAAMGHRGLETTERDLTGVYHAIYAADAAGHEVVRTKLRYEPLQIEAKGPGVDVPMLSTHVHDSKTTLRLSDNTLQSAELDETLGTPLSGTARVSSATTLRAVLKGSSAAVTLVPWETLASENVATQPGRMVAKAANTAQFDDLRIGNYTFDKALAELTESARHLRKHFGGTSGAADTTGPSEPAMDKGSFAADQRAFGALIGLLRHDTANVDRAAQYIIKNGMAADSLMDALSSAGTPPTQQALLSIIDNSKLTKQVRLRAAGALTRVASPTPNAVTTFTRLLHVADFDAIACYGLGTLSRRMRENGDFAAADAVSDTLVKELRETKKEDWTVTVLRGVANSGNGKAFASVEPFLTDRSARIREAAVSSLRLMMEPKVETVLQSILANETDDSVRVAALDACGMRPMTPGLLQITSTAVLSSKSTRVRQKAIQVLATWTPRNAEAKSALKSMSVLETNPIVRREAETAEKQLGGN